MTADYEFDVVVAGGGMVGASLAHALSTLSLRVAVIERAAPGELAQPSYDDRSTALSFGSQRIFSALGLWPLLKSAATPIRQIHVSDQGRFGVTRLHCEEEGVEALGYVIENRVLGRVLWQSLEQHTTVICPASVQSVATHVDAIDVVVSKADQQTETLRAKLLVVADGARSTTRDKLGIAAQTTSYEQKAVIANVTTQQPHLNIAYERFTPDGPLAFLPMSNGRCSVVWTQKPADADRTLALGDAAFLESLQAAFGYRLGRLTKTGSRFAYPLALVRAREITAPRAVIIGNAAHGLHPVAGQGFNLGLRDVAALADVVADVTANVGADAAPIACDPGLPTALRRYKKWRESDHERVIGLTDGLIKVFGSDFTPVQVARGAGLLALGLLRGPRALLARQSMGLTGTLPRLARGIPLR